MPVSNDVRSKTKKIISLIILSILFLNILFYIIACFSEPVTVAEAYIRSEAKIIAKIGDIEKIWLHPLGFNMKTSGASGSSEMKLVIRGNKKNGTTTVYVSMKRIAGVWEVQMATLKDENGRLVGIK